MCGIVGFTGKSEAAPIFLDGLSKLEYRGYDSAGIAVRNGDAEPEIVKAKGKLKVLKEMTNDGKAVKGSCGIGHTRWATHGEPSATNAHPHCSDDENVIAVHNGIIENYAEINTEVAAMDDAIQPVPPTPQFDDLTAEDAASLRTPLGVTFEVWADAFITGKKSTDTDWDAYVAEMKNLSIDQYLQMYNDNNK